MSIEPSQFDISFEMPSQDFHLFRYAPDGSLAAAVTDEKLIDRASGSLAVWRAAQGPFAADIGILRGPGRFSVASVRGGVILECKKPVNVGLVRRALRDRNPVDLSAEDALHSEGQEPMQGLLWAIAERFARVEAPRTFDFNLGGKSIPIRVTREGFAFLRAEDTLAHFLTEIEAVTRAGVAVDFGFLAEESTPAGLWHGVLELFPLGTEWLLDAAGWPKSAPETVDYPALRAGSALAQVMTDVGVSRFDLFEASGGHRLSIVREGDGFRVLHTFPPDVLSA